MSKYPYPTEFFVHPEKRTVVCKLHDTSEAFLEDMLRHNLGPGSENAYLNTLMNDVVIGKAVCQPTDTFDTEKGKRIAYKKAVKKLVAAKKRRLEAVLKDVKSCYDAIATLATVLGPKYDNVIKSCDEYIKRIAGDMPSTDKEGEK